MNTDPEMTVESTVRFSAPTETPSADFIHAISEFLDTDPNDLLMELGYYTRDDAATSF
jgi:hypothetical protein